MADIKINGTSEYLELKSPTVGKSSTIFLKKDSSSSSDFMLSKFGTVYGINGVYTYTAYGQRTLTLIKKVPNSIWGPTEDTAISVSVGNIIFSCNSINIPYDITEIYATCKSEINNELEIGSVYENYYLTGDSDTYNNPNPPVSGILGDYVKS